jgi:cytochrome c peroxidase
MVGEQWLMPSVEIAAWRIPRQRRVHGAINVQQKRGALLFFGKARCVECHAVAGSANEMFSDFQNRGIGVPQIAPEFGLGKGNVLSTGRAKTRILEPIQSPVTRRHKFRTAPRRNAPVQPPCKHNRAVLQFHHPP